MKLRIVNPQKLRIDTAAMYASFVGECVAGEYMWTVADANGVYVGNVTILSYTFDGSHVDVQFNRFVGIPAKIARVTEHVSMQTLRNLSAMHSYMEMAIEILILR